jgi:hypothetical protein
MRRPSVSKQICYWVLALALFAVRLADAHVHICLDGQEPRTSLHVADSGFHHDNADVLLPHNDQDVEAVDDGVSKKGESADLLLLPTLWSLVDFVPRYTVEPPRYAAVAPVISFRSHLRPPLRGPPR